MPDSLYHDALMALARAEHAGGRLAAPDRTARVDNPLCGDEVTIDLDLADGRVKAVGHRVRGCVLCEAAASWVGLHAPGCDAPTASTVLGEMRMLMEHGELDSARWPDTDVFAPVHRVKSRWRCVLLPLEALEQALAADADGTS